MSGARRSLPSCVSSARRGLRGFWFAAPPTRGRCTILQSELQRNFQTLKQQPTPAYFIGYTLHDERIDAPRGVVRRARAQRRVAQPLRHRRGARRRLRPRQHASDPRRLAAPWARASARVALPLTDDEQADPPRAVARDRSHVQAGERSAHARQDQRRREGQGGGSGARTFRARSRRPTPATPASYSLDTKAWEARLRRISAPFAEDPLVFRSDVSLSVDADNRYYTNSEGTQIATGDVACRLFIQAVTKADDGMELPLYHELLRQLAVRAAGREAADRRRPRR